MDCAKCRIRPFQLWYVCTCHWEEPRCFVIMLINRRSYLLFILYWLEEEATFKFNTLNAYQTFMPIDTGERQNAYVSLIITVLEPELSESSLGFQNVRNLRSLWKLLFVLGTWRSHFLAYLVRLRLIALDISRRETLGKNMFQGMQGLIFNDIMAELSM